MVKRAGRVVKRIGERCAVTIALASCLACGGGAGGGGESADALAEWTLSAEPLATIGGYDDRPAHALSMVRGGLILPGGEIAVSDGASREIRIFSADGEHARTLGGRGGGPGEFGTLGAISHGPDGGVCGWDGGPKRLTCFSRSGGEPTVAEADVEALQDGFFARFVGAFPDGSFVMKDAKPTMEMKHDPAGERRDSVSYLHFAADGSFRGVLARLPGAESYFLNEDQVWGDEPVLFGRTALHHLDGSLALALNDSLDVRLIDGAGLNVARFARPMHSRAVTREDVDSARAELLQALEVDEARRPWRADAAAEARLAAFGRKQIAERPHRETMPPFDELRIAHDGSLWLAEPRRLRATTRPWTVVDPSGEPVARVELPAGAQVLDVADGYVLLLVRDEMDVESVRIHALGRAGRPTGAK